ncbi:unnamed protein product [Adineta ricciae]|uniref:Nuclear receptor domain-containing protein n=1 Tax=Adineta ricciae TaxID=249248 RepID=A0A814NT30_ADIRI|nr:unnamed protein product [Adineta ricciae]CAF1398748.1 unnamed protein product [Adineta ricciae]
MNVTFDNRLSRSLELYPSVIIEDSIDECLVDPNLSVSAMIDQYNISTKNDVEKKLTKKDLTCAVCGAQAFGYNFDQISCESCKAFFRRNALKNLKDLQCRFSGTCDVTAETRRHCSHCRIKKCFAVGMRKEWIRSEEEKQKRLGQLKHTRRHKLSLEHIKKTPVPQSISPYYSSNLTSLDRVRLNNITHCYDQFSREPSTLCMSRPPESLKLRIHEFYDRKRPVFVNLINYFKHLPELQALHVDDQVHLIKQNLRLIGPLNYALIRTYKTQHVVPKIETVGCVNNANIHCMYRSLADMFMGFTKYDPIIIKIFLIILFFTSDAVTTTSIFQITRYEQSKRIKDIQYSYLELLWLYMLEKFGERDAIILFTKMITKYLHIQVVVDQIDSIVRMNSDVDKIDSLMQTILQLT